MQDAEGVEKRRNHRSIGFAVKRELLTCCLHEASSRASAMPLSLPVMVGRLGA